MSRNPEIAQLYNRMQISTSSNPHLICTLHQKILLLIKKFSKTNNQQHIITAQNLLATLSMSLKETDQISVLIQNLYSYCYELLEKKNTDSLNNAGRVIEILEETFSRLCGTNTTED
ncbi:hypothetical protein CHISP_1145 [Chitinispirillum alkaliphilum]|nr:hypothetical protein CHISP_1145 [Chitinispirillum alkaliphilum]